MSPDEVVLVCYVIHRQPDLFRPDVPFVVVSVGITRDGRQVVNPTSLIATSLGHARDLVARRTGATMVVDRAPTDSPTVVETWL